MDLLLLKTHRHVPGHLPGSNLGLNILRQILTARGYSVEEFQGYGERANRRIDAAMRLPRPPRVVGFYCDFNNYEWVRILAASVKKRYPRLILIAGGPQTVGFDAAYFRDSGIDAACVGESEESLPELMDFLFAESPGKKLGDIPGIVFPGETGELIRTADRRPPENLDLLPWPRIQDTDDFSQSGLLPILTGRGCPFGCTFCYEGANAKNVRWHSVDALLEEIAANLRDNPRIRYVNFLDDTFTLDRKRVLAISSGLKELRRDHDFVWFAGAHVQTVLKNPDMIGAMFESGLVKLFFGIESGDDFVLRQYNKRITREMILGAIRICRDAGLPSVAGNFILGGPFETPETVRASASLMEELLELAPGVFEAAFFTFLPYPNTAISNDPSRFGMTILHDRISCALEDIPLSRTDAFGFEELMNLRLEMNRNIQTKMRDIYAAGMISEEMVVGNYRNFLNHGVYTRWREHVYGRSPIDNAYWLALAGGGFDTLSGAGGDVGDRRPVRMFELWLYSDCSGERPTVYGKEISDFEFTVLECCGGRMTVREMIPVVARRRGLDAAKTADIEKQVMDALAALEGNRWILYARS